jgi:hypothetical protein
LHTPYWWYTGWIACPELRRSSRFRPATSYPPQSVLVT